MKKSENLLKIYLDEINKIPLLSREQEIEFALKAKAGDVVAREKIVNANLRFVVNVAKRYRKCGLELEDLISEGNVGLLCAIDKFDVKKGYHFISYAVWWIRQSILKAVAEKRSAIRLPLNRVAELSKIQATQKHISKNKSEEQQITEIAMSLGMDNVHVRELLEISREMVSLDSVVSSGKDKGATLGDLVEDCRYETPEDNSVKNFMKCEIQKTLDTLRPNEARVLRMRYGLGGAKPMSLQEVGKKCSLTKERIRQIEKCAIERMRLSSKKNNLNVYLAA